MMAYRIEAAATIDLDNVPRTLALQLLRDREPIPAATSCTGQPRPDHHHHPRPKSPSPPARTRQRYNCASSATATPTSLSSTCLCMSKAPWPPPLAMLVTSSFVGQRFPMSAPPRRTFVTVKSRPDPGPMEGNEHQTRQEGGSNGSSLGSPRVARVVRACVGRGRVLSSTWYQLSALPRAQAARWCAPDPRGHENSVCENQGGNRKIDQQ